MSDYGIYRNGKIVMIFFNKSETEMDSIIKTYNLVDVESYKYTYKKLDVTYKEMN